MAGGMEAAHLRGGGEAGGPDHLSPCCGGPGGPVGGCCHGGLGALRLDVRVGGLRHDGGSWAWAQDWGVSWWPLHPCFGSWRALAFHWTVGGCALSGGLDSSGLVPFSLGSLGGHPGRGCGRAGVGHRASGDPPPHASGWVLVQLVFQSVGSFLAGGDDWGGLSFPYWVFLPPA